MGMLTEAKTKIRALIEDIGSSSFETFTYTTTNIFTIAQENITITKVLKNGVELGSGEYSFDSTTNKITITAALTSGDTIEVDYTFYKYGDTELIEFIRAALVWMSIYADCSTDYEIEENDIYPTPDNKTEDMIALVASILIKPDYSEYRLPNLTVRYPRNITKEEKIERLVRKFHRGIGEISVLEWD